MHPGNSSVAENEEKILQPGHHQGGMQTFQCEGKAAESGGYRKEIPQWCTEEGAQGAA